MRIACRRFAYWLVLGILSVTLLKACNTSNPRVTNTLVTDNQPPVECQVIQHEFGKTCVPLNPQRIVALSPDLTLDPLIALGIKPVGYTADKYRGKEVLLGVSLDDVAGATNVGKPDQPSVEKILMVKPDLILATKYHPHDLLSAIAPTVVVPTPNLETPEDEAFFKLNLRYVAQVLGKEAKAEEVLNQYYKRIEQLQQRLGNQLKQIEVSVIYYASGLVYTPARNYDATADVLIDTGVRYKRPAPGANISIESIDEYNTDILFIINTERRPRSFYTQHPIFSRLKAFKNNHAYLVPLETWDTRGISGANKILDDLFKYLLDG